MQRQSGFRLLNSITDMANTCIRAPADAKSPIQSTFVCVPETARCPELMLYTCLQQLATPCISPSYVFLHTPSKEFFAEKSAGHAHQWFSSPSAPHIQKSRPLKYCPSSTGYTIFRTPLQNTSHLKRKRGRGRQSSEDLESHNLDNMNPPTFEWLVWLHG